MKMNIAGLLALGNFMPLAPRVEEVALHGQNAVEASQKQWLPLGALRVEQRNQLMRQAAGAEQVAGSAGFAKGRKPTAESTRVLLPGASRGFLQVARGIGAEQLVGLHGQSR